jgi:chromosome segregation ATPase
MSKERAAKVMQEIFSKGTYEGDLLGINEGGGMSNTLAIEYSKTLPALVEARAKIVQLERELAEAMGDVEHLELEIANESAKITDYANYLADSIAANKILAKEKDECSNGWNGALATVQRLERELAEAVAKERERCAKVSEEYPGALHSRQEELMAYDIAAAIRKGE